ncbi:MAG: hypothetical protein SF123_01900 [Chloroflexota bacterium]|nr:hypothetical protein [Chloroflexota bacterium]
MNQSLPFLSSKTNLPEVWEANSAGKFTAGQRGYIDYLNYDSQEISALGIAQQTHNQMVMKSSTGALTALVLITIATISRVNSFVLGIVVLLLALGAAIWISQQAKDRIESFKPPIPQYAAQVFSKCGKLQFSQNGLTPLVKLDGLSFEIMGELWWQLREMGEQFAVYYTTLRDGRQVLLSIEPLDYPHAPTSALLATVVGIGDDGELVYADEASNSTRSLVE